MYETVKIIIEIAIDQVASISILSSIKKKKK